MTNEPDETNWWKDSPEGYEVLAPLIEEDGQTELTAAYTPNNGIRISIHQNFADDPEVAGQTEDGWDICLREFDFTTDQAQKLGEALLRWSASRRKPEVSSP